MGLFGNNFGDKLMRAGAIMEGDWGAAGAITQGIQRRKSEEEANAAKVAEREMVFRALLERDIPEADAIIMLQNMDATGKAMAENWAGRNAVRQGNDTISVPDPNSPTGYRFVTPAQWLDGSYFTGSDGSLAPEALVEEEKFVPVERGGGAIGVGPYSGKTRTIVQPGSPQGAAQTVQEGQTVWDDQGNEYIMQNGVPVPKGGTAGNGGGGF